MKKVYDIKLGHYVAVNEDDNTGENVEQTNDEQKKQQQQAQPQNLPTESNADIQKINNDLAAENKRYNTAKQVVVNTYNTNKQAA